MSIQTHLTVILDKAGQMRQRAEQQISLVEETERQIKEELLSPQQLAQIEAAFEGIENEYEDASAEFGIMDNNASTIEVILGI